MLELLWPDRSPHAGRRMGVSRAASGVRAVRPASPFRRPLRVAGPGVAGDSTRKSPPKGREQNSARFGDLGRDSLPRAAERAVGRGGSIGFNSGVNRIRSVFACVVPGLLVGLLVARPCAAAEPTQSPAGQSVAMQSMATLRADQRTILLRAGERVIAHQPDVDHGRVLTVIGSDGVRSLTVGLGQPGVDERGAANFEARAVAAAPGGEVLLYVAPLGRADVGGIWRWRPGNEPARRVIAARDVADASGLGTLLPLAEVQMAAAGSDVWVMLRGPDAAAYCRLDARRLDAAPRLARAFDAVRDSAAPLAVERQDSWSGRADGALTLFRPSRGQAWRVDATGRATTLTAPESDAVDALPQNERTTPTAPPLDVRANDRPQVLRFYPDAPRFAPLPGGGVRYPALVLGSGKDETVIGRDALLVRPGFPVYGLRLTAWCVDAAGSVVTYDAMSGEIFRLNPAGS